MLCIAGRMKASAPTMSNAPRHTHVIARAAVPPDNAHPHFRNRFPILFARYRSFLCHCEERSDVAISRHSSTNAPKTCVRRIVRRRLPRRSFRPPRNDMLFCLQGAPIPALSVPILPGGVMTPPYNTLRTHVAELSIVHCQLSIHFRPASVWHTLPFQHHAFA